MISKQFLRWAALLPLVSVLTACADNRLPLDTCIFPDFGSERAQAPDWICTERLEGGPKIQAVGSHKMTGSVSLAKRSAEVDATARIAAMFQTAIKELVRKSASSVGGEELNSVDRAVSAFTEQNLTGAKAIQQTRSPGGVYYVLVGLNPRLAIDVLNGSIEAVNKSLDTVNLQKVAHEEAMKRLEEASNSVKSGG